MIPKNKIMKQIICSCVPMVVAMFFLFQPFNAFSQVNVPGYSIYYIDGTVVYVDNTATTFHPVEAQRALDLLKANLREIDGLNISSSAKNKLRSVRIFIDWNIDLNKAAEYHPNATWLIQNGYRPEKHQAVNIDSIYNYLTWTSNQPYMILHELAHAYHDQVLSFDNVEVLNAYQNAMNAGKYKNAYAATNHKEYFSEITEAFFGRNDFYPFVKNELKTYDPIGYSVLASVWGVQSNTNDGEFDPNKSYRLTTEWKGEGKSLDVKGDGENLRLANTGNYSGQHWKITKLQNGYYRLTTEWKGEGKSLDVKGDGENLRLANTGNYSGQHWKITKLQNGYYRLTTEWKGEGKSLDVKGDGENLRLANTGNYSGQHWKIRE